MFAEGFSTENIVLTGFRFQFKAFPISVVELTNGNEATNRIRFFYPFFLSTTSLTIISPSDDFNHPTDNSKNVPQTRISQRSCEYNSFQMWTPFL